MARFERLTPLEVEGTHAHLARPRSTPRPGGFRGLSPLERGDLDVERELRERRRTIRIRCPHCKWQPGRHNLWTCLPIGPPENYKGGCGHSWNTFQTRGLCPGCDHQWLFTSCLVCALWALHEDWYEEVDEPSAGSQ